jgi:hypothetical protein
MFSPNFPEKPTIYLYQVMQMKWMDHIFSARRTA